MTTNSIAACPLDISGKLPRGVHAPKMRARFGNPNKRYANNNRHYSDGDQQLDCAETGFSFLRFCFHRFAD
ncbi:MAG TPA: hypothetical protein VLH87_05370 [Pyrinomonadaceae bacterium]|nr:hypothetical protein [Pyrinomonadaceae bacterium]